MSAATQWERATIAVATRDGPQGIEAEVCGPFAVHRQLDSARGSKKWTLTHVPSGKRIGGAAFRSARQAKAVAEGLMDWTDVDWREKAPTLPRDVGDRWYVLRRDVETSR